MEAELLEIAKSSNEASPDMDQHRNGLHIQRNVGEIVVMKPVARVYRVGYSIFPPQLFLLALVALTEGGNCETKREA